MIKVVFPYILVIAYALYICLPAWNVLKNGGVKDMMNFANWLLGLVVLTILVVGWFVDLDKMIEL